MFVTLPQAPPKGLVGTNNPSSALFLENGVDVSSLFCRSLFADNLWRRTFSSDADGLCTIRVALFLIRYDTPSTRKSRIRAETELLRECSVHPHVVDLHGTIDTAERWAHRCVGYQ